MRSPEPRQARMPIPREGPKAAFVRGFRIGIAATIAVVVLLGLVALFAIDSHRDILREAVATPPGEEGYREGYFPAQFPPPAGMPEEHIEAF